MRKIKEILLENPADFKRKLLSWAQQFDELVCLDSNPEFNRVNQLYSSFDFILAAEALTAIKTDFQNAFDKLEEYKNTTNDWIFGYLTYDLKNDVEDVTSTNPDCVLFPDLYFFQPKKLFFINKNKLEMHYLHFVADEMEEDVNAILNVQASSESVKSNHPKIQARLSKQVYIEKVKQMLHHIQMGDIYEANFCQEFYAEDVSINPLQTFEKLNDISSPPFAAFVKLEEHFLLSASPERYLKKEGTKIISQPIKGTARRSQNKEEDLKLAIALQTEEKERSENIMITDLVRNDLSRTATRGSVKVEELCGLYSFKQVHQLISTVVSEVAETTSIVDVLKTTFPMGSMTGAPKVSAMKIIEELEETKRGLYSGAVGYISPQGNADFNVVIRSILYNRQTDYLSFSVGSAITTKSIPENEYEECLLKAKAIMEVLNK
ncbi:MAG: aminodeoxychorismate synthase component I [Flavobacteriaceae bacterium]|nr:aminodeoxychorismate synthase component I [Flavobacteriaceae bacterium]